MTATLSSARANRRLTRNRGASEIEKRQTLRCAIYTRVSTDSGLEQDFNSLDAQREACGAYIRSQAHEGWKLAPGHYDDGGYSGGNLDRPVLTKLLEAVKRRQIDIIVVYKVDRLTRSLRDFAKLVEDFDEHDVSFISITQSFSTTTSMGRLTLNMLLSFAQFEREVTGERIRDKIAASKRKGIWVGGVVPLGYRVVERKLLVDEAEAKIVRLIFDRYLALGSLGALTEELRESGIVTRRRALATGKSVGGVPFTKGPLAYFLRNRMYVGELNHGAESYPGEHQAIVTLEAFDAVQARLSSQAAASNYRQSRSEALLQGRLYDDRGNRMTPSYAVKGGVRYRYYVSRASTEGRKDVAGSIGRVPAADIERVVTQTIGSFGKFETEAQAINEHVERITIQPKSLRIALTADAAEIVGREVIVVDWVKPPFRVNREILPPADGERDDPRAMTFDTRGRLLIAIGKARIWASDLISGRETHIESLARKEGRSVRSVSMLLSLAFLAPSLIKAVAENRMPRGIGLTRMTDLPSEWPMQWRALGACGRGAGHPPRVIASASARQTPLLRDAGGW